MRPVAALPGESPAAAPRPRALGVSFRPEGSGARSRAASRRGRFGAVASCGAGRGREAALSGSPPPPEAAPAQEEDAQELAGASPDQNFVGCPPPSPQSLGRAPAGGGQGGAAASPPPVPLPPWLRRPPLCSGRASGRRGCGGSCPWCSRPAEAWLPEGYCSTRASR